MAIVSGIGAVIEPPPGVLAHAFWFGEEQARYVITTKRADVLIERAERAGVPLVRLGATGGRILSLAGERPLRVDDLKHRHESWLPTYMAASA
jgi:phosphoribosylformylglycinamidine synthase